MTNYSHWLVKTEPESYSVDDFLQESKKTTFWDGVRNYQARNFLRDSMKRGQQVFIYHSNADPPAIVGVAKVVKEGYPDFTAWEQDHPHFDEGSTPENPRWYMVDLQLVKKFAQPLTLPHLKTIPALAGMELLRKGSRLSVQGVTSAEFDAIMELANG